ncbi:MAG: T9SS type A sorting domain-containing protein [Bacteroidia bacterium]|nr:T9SS type A sorting domain-containing protein [Bacteroidia bacterium]
MKKQLSKIALGIALLSAVTGFSQEGKIQPCNTFAAMEEYFVSNPEARKSYEAQQEQLQKLVVAQSANKSSAAFQYTIPVVFHILHLGGSENVSDATCINAINQMNLDYAAAGPDVNTVAAPFQSLYINSDIKFMLAHKDPAGNCTSGIEHIYDARTNWSQSNVGTNYAGLTWDPTKYLNIFVVKQIIPTGTVTGGGIIVGYTYKPGTWGSGALQDAITYNYQFLTGMTNIRSLSHEAGHWLNLTHTFGNTNNPGVVCGDDGVSDTPWTKGNFSACPSSLTGNTCSGGPGSNVENIMDYSSCPKNFTQGQTAVMRAALASGVSGRNNLSTGANLIATDVDGAGICAPIANYISTTGYTVCSGGSLTMKDLSYNGVITTYAWSADNGAVIASPAASLTSITFPTQGVTTITLNVSNGQGNSSKVRTVTVLNGTPFITGNYYESFENPGVPINWSVINTQGIGWDQTNIAAKDGSGSYFLDGTQSQFGQVDILVMPIMDVVNNPSNLLTFSYAYARQTSTHNDKLVLQGSLDCGGTWIDVVNLSAATMASGSGGVTSTPYAPSSASEWKDVDVTTYPYWFNFANSPSALFRFVFTEDATNGMGNRLFLDALNFQNPNGLNELTKSYNLNIFPNPSNGEITVKFNLNDASTVKVNVVDVLGKNVLPVSTHNFGSGEQAISINKGSTLAKGIYFVNLNVNGAKLSKKLVIN